MFEFDQGNSASSQVPVGEPELEIVNAPRRAGAEEIAGDRLFVPGGAQQNFRNLITPLVDRRGPEFGQDGKFSE